MTTKEAVALLERYSNYDGMGIPNLAGCKEAMRVAVDALKEACPELAESEDERMRRALIKLMTVAGESYVMSATGFKKEQLLAYLEKQKENIEKEYVFRPLAGTDITVAAEQAIRRANEGGRLVLAFNGAYIPVRKGNNVKKIVDIYDSFIEKQKEIPLMGGDTDTYFDDLRITTKPLTSREWFDEGIKYAQRLQKEQKPAEWSEDSVKFKEGFKAGRESGLRDGQKYVLNNLDSYGLCKPVEWSEEDKRFVRDAIAAVEAFYSEGCGQEELVNWLKSLHPSWKPSEEQMEALKDAVRLFKETHFEKYHYKIESLYEQLKKL